MSIEQNKPRRKRIMNPEGVDVSHFRWELQKAMNDLKHSTHKEIARRLVKIANEADHATTMITANALEKCSN